MTRLSTKAAAASIHVRANALWVVCWLSRAIPPDALHLRHGERANAPHRRRVMHQAIQRRRCGKVRGNTDLAGTTGPAVTAAGRETEGTARTH
ncbi:hypothetical protein OKW50_003603 [Paraburkholderia youngii]|uniref:Uncharacterized protein n=1 Tax=Paraburkholderia youngii TaxID=2782701 RepID=A0A7W8L746_9BURK|nr:hypothetical protein [Paraburkholderia youngii]MBB5401737.1 hypothetical protein [Paraburkholderia youngii]NVI06946.1 hypothetical protein [Paraburkholderia youngii]